MTESNTLTVSDSATPTKSQEHTTEVEAAATPAPSSPKPASDPTVTSTSALPTESDPKSKSKPRGKTNRTRQRRRANGSDNESEAESAGSLSSRSDQSDEDSEEEDADEDEEDEAAVENAIDPPVASAAADSTSAFVDVSSSTPAGWNTDLKKDGGAEAEEISFDDFNAGKLGQGSRGRGAAPAGAGRGRGRGGVVAVAVVEGTAKRVYTVEETAKYEAAKAKRKEKQKAKRAELKLKAKEGEAASASGTKSTAVKAPEDAKVDTSAAKHNGPAPSTTESTRPPVNAVKSTDRAAQLAKATKEPGSQKAKPAKGKAVKKPVETSAAPQPSVSSITASTSALTLDGPGSGSAPVQSAEPNGASPGSSTSTTESDIAPLSEVQTQTEAEPETQATAAPSRPQHAGNREAYAQRVATDPKFTPRVGQFWTHDQRLYEGGQVGDGGYSGLRQMSEFWRGRGGFRGAAFGPGGMRGGPRGRGRGGFFGPRGGGFAGAPGAGVGRPVELTEPVASKGKGSRLAMDREIELEEERARAKERQSQAQAQALAQAQIQAEAQAPASASEAVTDATPTEDSSPAAPVPIVSPPPSQPSADRKWGHEAYESITAVERIRANGPGPVFRGRGRGRGGFFPRGGHFNGPTGFPPRPISSIPAHTASPADLPSQPPQEATPSPSAITQATTPSAPPLEATQTTSESLLDEAGPEIKIRLPGSTASVVSSRPVSSPTKVADASELSASSAPLASADPTSVPTASAVPIEVAQPVQPPAPSPIPVAALQAQMYTGGSGSSPYHGVPGSDNGSASSGAFLPQHTGPYLPPGVGVTPTGEFFPLANGMALQGQANFYAQRNYQQQQQQHQGQQAYFPPQPAYSPDLYQHQAQAPLYSGGLPIQSPQGVFFPGSANGYSDGRTGSPLNPYAQQAQVGGYFAPARSSTKVSIKAPTPGTGPGENDDNEDASPSTGTPADSQDSKRGRNGQVGYRAYADANGNGQAGYYSQAYNPYVNGNGAGAMGMSGQESMYYPSNGSNGYTAMWPGYEQQGGYNGNYGY